MFGIGFFELIVIAVVALIFIGPTKLPDFMRQAGRAFVQVRRTANDVRSTVDHVISDAENELRLEETEKLKKLLGAQDKSASTTDRTSQASAMTSDPLKANQPAGLEPSGEEPVTECSSTETVHHHLPDSKPQVSKPTKRPSSLQENQNIDDFDQPISNADGQIKP